MIFKIIARTLFYQLLFICIVSSSLFILNPSWFGKKYVLIERSMYNIFFPVEYNEDVEDYVRFMGSLRIWTELNYPAGFKVLEDRIINKEFYKAIVSYIDSDGKEHQEFKMTRVRWQTWEYHYDEENSET